ncbi:hypothetical protein GCM10022216_05750 [Sphingobacterium kyonggiense]|uniref:Uncharacterized protein n=1 Tax=Sphingobacterium kyonggiense TaxID=714075 RepID=A0ABP7YB77_9SPHI
MFLAVAYCIDFLKNVVSINNLFFLKYTLTALGYENFPKLYFVDYGHIRLIAILKCSRAKQ